MIGKEEYLRGFQISESLCKETGLLPLSKPFEENTRGADESRLFSCEGEGAVVYNGRDANHLRAICVLRIKRMRRR